MKRRINREKMIVSAVIAAGLSLIAVGFSVGTTGREAQRLPDEIEQISPGPGDTVLVQSQVFVDFVPGYAATLTIDGIELETTRLDELSAGGGATRPGAQVEIPPTAIYDPGNFTISYLPQEGGAIESFSQGTHRASVRFWKIEDGPSKARSFSWEFTTN